MLPELVADETPLMSWITHFEISEIGSPPALKLPRQYRSSFNGFRCAMTRRVERVFEVVRSDFFGERPARNERAFDAAADEPVAACSEP